MKRWPRCCPARSPSACPASPSSASRSTPASCATWRSRRPSRSRASTSPTIVESGLDVTLSNWRGVVAPAELSDEDRASLLWTIDQMVNSEEWAAELERNGWDYFYQSGDAFAEFLAEQTDADRGDPHRDRPRVSDGDRPRPASGGAPAAWLCASGGGGRRVGRLRAVEGLRDRRSRRPTGRWGLGSSRSSSRRPLIILGVLFVVQTLRGTDVDCRGARRRRAAHGRPQAGRVPRRPAHRLRRAVQPAGYVVATTALLPRRRPRARQPPAAARRRRRRAARRSPRSSCSPACSASTSPAG